VRCKDCGILMEKTEAEILDGRCWECHKKVSVCAKCPERSTCEWAYDPYNDEESCLCEK